MIPSSRFGFLISACVFLVVLGSFISKNAILESSLSLEVCDNGLDDDNDGLIDLNDPECACKRIDFESMIPNPSFESISCCPTKEAQMECVDSWDQASLATTDYMNECGWTDRTLFAPPRPLPHGAGFLRIVNGHTIDPGDPNNEKIPYKEYAAICLNNPLQKDSIYGLELYLGFIEITISSDINLSVYGSANCENLPFSKNFDCPSKAPEWFLMTSEVIKRDFGGGWKKVRLEFQPDQDIAAIAIGPDCELVEAPQYFYYFIDNIILDELQAFDFQLEELTVPCSPDFVFAVQDRPDYAYQWYKDGIAIVGETAAQLSAMRGEGNYQLRIIHGEECRVSADYPFFLPVPTDTISQTICTGTEFWFNDNLLTEPGIYVDTLTSISNCDSIVTLILRVEDVISDTLAAQILAGATFRAGNRSFTSEGEHQIQLTSEQGCDSLLVLQLSLTNIYFPNAFSPNGDGINETFQIIGAQGEIADLDLSIYNRWGNLIYSGQEWDGTARGQSVPSGVFVYIARITTTEGQELRYGGSVTLIR